jgi:hypothetical protein
MASKIPSNQFIIFPKADHSMESDVPDLFFNAIRNFIHLEARKNLTQKFFQPKFEQITVQSTNSNNENHILLEH